MTTKEFLEELAKINKTTIINSLNSDDEITASKLVLKSDSYTFEIVTEYNRLKIIIKERK